MQRTRIMIVIILLFFTVTIVSLIALFSGENTNPETSTSLQNARLQQEISGEEYAVKKEDYWTAFDDGYLDITTYDCFKQGEELIIPAEYQGVRIKTFSVYFDNMEESQSPYLKRIIIEKGIQEIDTSFHGCGALESVKIPDSVKKIEQGAFSAAEKTVVLYVEKGSYAEKYATKMKIHYKYM